jgi:molecular chaperone GrpE
MAAAMTDESPPTPEIPVEVDAPEEAAVETSLEDRLAQLEKDKKETYDRLLRTAADFDNYRKRARRDQDEAALKAKETVLKEMLPIIDNLERALAAAQAAQGDSTAASVIDGVKLVLRQFTSALERFEVKVVEAIGKPFDPSFHEAISQIPTTDQPNGTVVAEMQRGYTIGTRLLRPALVAVAKSPEPPPAPPEEVPEG